MNSAADRNDSTTTVLELKNVVQQFVIERQWKRFHNLKNLSMSLAIEAAELMEHTQWLSSEQVETAAAYDLPAVTEELADVLSYALAIANVLEIDISVAVREKMVKNRAKYPIASALTAQGRPTIP